MFLAHLLCQDAEWHSNREMFLATEEFYRDSAWAVYSPLEKHTTLPERLPWTFMPVVQIFGNLTVQNVTHHPYILYRLQASLKNVFSTKWKKSVRGNTEYSDNTHEGGSCFDRVSSFPNIHKFPHRTVLELATFVFPCWKTSGTF